MSKLENENKNVKKRIGLIPKLNFFGTIEKNLELH
jgi:hypothetical protein